MDFFEDIQDVEEWLAPLDYDAFWEAIEPLKVLDAEDRAHADQNRAKAEIGTDLVLSCLKTMVRRDLTDRFGLTDRVHEPVQAKYLRSVH